MIPRLEFDESSAWVPGVFAAAEPPLSRRLRAGSAPLEPAATRIVLRGGAPKFSICAVVVTIKGIKQ